MYTPHVQGGVVFKCAQCGLNGARPGPLGCQMLGPEWRKLWVSVLTFVYFGVLVLSHHRTSMVQSAETHDSNP